MFALLEKLKEVTIAVVPMTVIVLVLSFTLAPLPGALLARFIIGAVFIIIGMSVFLLGIELSISPLGEDIGAALSKTNKLWIVAGVSIVVGFFMSVAEPDLQILAEQIAEVTNEAIGKFLILIVVSIGVAVLLAVGIARIVYNFPLYKMLFILYGLVLILALFVPPEFLAVAFDSSGVTTGALTMPFILSLALGVSAMKKNSKASEKDSFGLVAIASAGAIISVLMMSIAMGSPHLTGELAVSEVNSTDVLGVFAARFPNIALTSVITIIPLTVIFIVFQIKALRLKRKAHFRIWIGFAYTLVGLIILMTGAESGFMDAGSAIGIKLTETRGIPALSAVGFVLGAVAILAEPAIHILTKQIETVTAGYIKKFMVLAALALGVGIAVALSVLRMVVPEIHLWHYLLPGYIISIGLSFIAPKLFVGIAFDAGGMSSGIMTSTFILAFSEGVANAAGDAEIVSNTFGTIALIAMMPIITLQILGLLVRLKYRKKGVTN